MLIAKCDQITVARKTQQSATRCRFRAYCLQTLRPLAKNRNPQRPRLATQGLSLCPLRSQLPVSENPKPRAGDGHTRTTTTAIAKVWARPHWRAAHCATLSITAPIRQGDSYTMLSGRPPGRRSIVLVHHPPARHDPRRARGRPNSERCRGASRSPRVPTWHSAL